MLPMLMLRPDVPAVAVPDAGVAAEAVPAPGAERMRQSLMLQSRLALRQRSERSRGPAGLWKSSARTGAVWPV